MNHKRNIIITIIVLGGMLTIFIGLSFHNRKIYKTHSNVENSKRIVIGMQKKKVVKIMGNPDARLLSFENHRDSMYYYTPPFAASEGIYIQFDTLEEVNKIFPYE